MMVLPADHQIDLEKVEKAVGKPVSLDTGAGIQVALPRLRDLARCRRLAICTVCQHMWTRDLAEQDYIVFEAGTHTDAIKMSYRDYEKIVKPRGEDLAIKLQPMKGARLRAKRSARDEERASIQCIHGLLLRGSLCSIRADQLSQRRRFLSSRSTERSGRRRRVTFRAASMKRGRRTPSVWSFNSTRRVACSIRRKRSCKAFSASPVPVVVYVAPTGATATSAGCFITIAASVAAMAPATTIGAAHPVSIGGFPSGGEEKTDDTMKQKLENFSVSYIETIAGKRHRNVEWAKSAVKESASITAEKALRIKSH